MERAIHTRIIGSGRECQLKNLGDIRYFLQKAEVAARPSLPSRSTLTDYARDERDLQANMLMRATA